MSHFKLFTGLYGGLLSTLAAIVTLELKKREAETSAVRILFRTLITCKEFIKYFSSTTIIQSKVLFQRLTRYYI